MALFLSALMEWRTFPSRDHRDWKSRADDWCDGAPWWPASRSSGKSVQWCSHTHTCIHTHAYRHTRAHTHTPLANRRQVDTQVRWQNWWGGKVWPNLFMILCFCICNHHKAHVSVQKWSGRWAGPEVHLSRLPTRVTPKAAWGFITNSVGGLGLATKRVSWGQAKAGPTTPHHPCTLVTSGATPGPCQDKARS